jgi:predicted acyltransferase (DUF342 family)
MKRFKGFIILFFILLCISPLQASEEYYTIQAGSFKSIQEAERKYALLEEKLSPEKRDFLRIELVKGYYTLRIGKFNSFKEAKVLLPEIKELFPSSLILKAFVLDKRIKKLYRYKETESVAAVPIEREKVPLKTEAKKTKERPKYVEADTEKVEPAPTEVKRYAPVSKVVPFKFILPVVFIVVVGFVIYYNRRRILIMMEEITGTSKGVRRILKKSVDKDYRHSCLEAPRYLSSLLVERVKNIMQDTDINRIDMPVQIRVDKPVKDSLWICKELNNTLKRSTGTIMVLDDLVIPEGEKVLGEMLVKGDVKVSRTATVRSIVSEGEIKIGKRAKILKYLDADMGIKAEDGCILGEAVSTERELYIEKECQFTCLYGKPIRTYNFTSTLRMHETDNLITLQAKHLNVPVKFLKDSLLFTKKELIIPELIRTNKNVVTTESLTIKKGCVINGYIKAQKDIIIHDDVMINGAIYSYGNLVIGRNVKVYGSISSEGRIVIDSGVRIGGRDKEVKVFSKKEIELMENVEIYGTVYAEEGGRVI